AAARSRSTLVFAGLDMAIDTGGLPFGNSVEVLKELTGNIFGRRRSGPAILLRVEVAADDLGGFERRLVFVGPQFVAEDNDGFIASFLARFAPRSADFAIPECLVCANPAPEAILLPSGRRSAFRPRSAMRADLGRARHCIWDV